MDAFWHPEVGLLTEHVPSPCSPSLLLSSPPQASSTALERASERRHALQAQQQQARGRTCNRAWSLLMLALYVFSLASSGKGASYHLLHC